MASRPSNSICLRAPSLSLCCQYLEPVEVSTRRFLFIVLQVTSSLVFSILIISLSFSSFAAFSSVLSSPSLQTSSFQISHILSICFRQRHGRKSYLLPYQEFWNNLSSNVLVHQFDLRIRHFQNQYLSVLPAVAQTYSAMDPLCPIPFTTFHICFSHFLLSRFAIDRLFYLYSQNSDPMAWNNRRRRSSGPWHSSYPWPMA